MRDADAITTEVPEGGLIDRWRSQFGPAPLVTSADADAKVNAQQKANMIVAAYRDRYGITNRRPLGPASASSAREQDAAAARAAIRTARYLAHEARDQRARIRGSSRDIDALVW